MPEFQPKVCSVCQKLCKPFFTSNVTSSEWFCSNCHKSYAMDPQLAEALQMQEMRERRGNAAR